MSSLFGEDRKRERGRERDEMKVYVCITGWEEGVSIHDVVDSEDKAEVWVEHMNKVVLPEIKRLSDIAFDFQKRGTKEAEDAFIEMQALCDKHHQMSEADARGDAGYIERELK